MGAERKGIFYSTSTGATPVEKWVISINERGMNNMKSRKDYLIERMQDDTFKDAYAALEPDFTIAHVLLQYRSDNDLTQAELAEMIQINRGDLSKLESASANPTLKTLKKIAKALDANLHLTFERKTKSL